MMTLRDEDDDQLTDLMMKYDYENFQKFDHRLSLYCDIALFPSSSSEEVVGIARVSQRSSTSSIVPLYSRFCS